MQDSRLIHRLDETRVSNEQPRSASLSGVYPSELTGLDEKLVIVMVGLPGRGKTYTARKLTRYLSWLGYRVSMFNIGIYRRELAGCVHQPSFYDPHNEEAASKRLHFAKLAMADLLQYLVEKQGQMAVYDGTNTTRERQQLVLDMVQEAAVQSGQKLRVLWIECVSEDEDIINHHLEETLKMSPDYAGDAPNQMQELKQRIQYYVPSYRSLENPDWTYIRLTNMGKQVFANGIEGYIPSRILFFVMNLRTKQKPIYFSRHGESEFNVLGRIGGDSGLSKRGKKYAAKLGTYIAKELEHEKPYTLWCSTLQRTIETSSHIKDATAVPWRALSEIEVGICDGMTYEEVEEQYPDEFQARAKNKLTYRYPRGESYLDVIQRLEPVIFEIERCPTSVVVVAHRAVLRCLYAYFVDLSAEDVPYVNIPLHCVIKMSPKAYGTHVGMHPLGVDSVDLRSDQKLT